MTLKKSPRRSLTAIAAVAAVAGAMLVIPTSAAPAFASDTSTAASLFVDLNAHRALPTVNVPAVGPNGYANQEAHDRAVNYSHCASPCNFGLLPAPAHTAPTTPDSPDFDVPIYAHVSTGSHEASRLLTALLAHSSAVIEASLYNIAGIGIHTRGSKVYGVIEMLAYVTPPAGYLGFATPTISGTAKVGHTLTVHYSAAVPDNGDTTGITYSVDWRVGATNEGTGPSFLIPAALVGDHIYARVTVQKTGFVDRIVNSASTAATAHGTFTYTGSSKIGQLFYAYFPEPVASPAGTMTYKWYRDGHFNGTTTLLYDPTTNDIGHVLAVKETVADPGYTTKSVTVSKTFEGLSFFNTAAPTITGTPEVGDTLTAHITTWNPAPAATTITWKANGVAISGAHGTTLLLKHAQLGKKITVTFKSVLSDFKPTSLTSVSTSKVIS